MIEKGAPVSSIKGTNEQSLVNEIISEEMLLLCELKKKIRRPTKERKKKKSEMKRWVWIVTLSLTDLPSSHFLMIVSPCGSLRNC